MVNFITRGAVHSHMRLQQTTHEDRTTEQFRSNSLPDPGGGQPRRRAEQALDCDRVAEAGSHETTTCPECSANIRSESCGEHTEWYCSDCGLVVDVDEMDYGREWREFDDRDPSRGVSKRDELSHDYGLGSKIGKQTATESWQFVRMRQWDSHSKRVGADWTLVYAFKEVRTVVSQLGFPKDVAVRASRIFREAQQKDVFGSGNVREIFVGGAVYAACRELEHRVIPKQIADHLSIDDESVQGDSGVKKAIWRAYEKLCDELGLEPKLVGPPDYVPLILSQCREQLSPLQKPAIAIAEVAADQHWSTGRNPRSIAAGAVYLAAQALAEYPLSQGEIAKYADISSESVSRAKTDILDNCEKAVDEAVSDGEVSQELSPSQSAVEVSQQAQISNYV